MSCPAGLSLAMAPMFAIGAPRAAFLLVPLFGALLIGATYVVGARFGARIGVASALVTAASPAMLFQLVQPMSDVPAAALWMSAVAAVTGTRRYGAAVGGLAAGGAVLIRPNLVPLAVPLALFLLWRPERTWSERLRAGVTFAACLAPGIAAVALIQQVFFGSPLASGYGSLAMYFSIDSIAPNAARYTAWLSQTQTPVWLLAALAPFVLPGPLTRLLAALCLVNIAGYLPYVVFDDWSYLRFLLPTIPLLVILAIAVVDAVCRRTASWTARPIVAVLVVALAVIEVREAQTRNVFRMQALEARYAIAGAFVDRRLPPNAIVITSMESGSVRFYSGRRTLVWDGLDPAWLDRAVTYLRARGLEPFLLFETWEEPLFRKRFGASPLGALDWPPFAEVASRVRIYRPDDRETYRRGVYVPTEYAR